MASTPHGSSEQASESASARQTAPILGELQPVGGGDPIPLLKTALLVGRRENCDIVLRFPNVSGSHCELSLNEGYWFVKDLGSSNGTKVNGTRVTESRLDPGDKLSIARHEFEVAYDPIATGGVGGGRLSAPQRDIFSRSLLSAAGLESRRPKAPAQPGRTARGGR
jgi:pSer/pThr/pTyr-binding forkhead associated (FHA) protein